MEIFCLSVTWKPCYKKLKEIDLVFSLPKQSPAGFFPFKKNMESTPKSTHTHKSYTTSEFFSSGSHNTALYLAMLSEELRAKSELSSQEGPH